MRPTRKICDKNKIYFNKFSFHIFYLLQLLVNIIFFIKIQLIILLKVLFLFFYLLDSFKFLLKIKFKVNKTNDYKQ